MSQGCQGQDRPGRWTAGPSPRCENRRSAVSAAKYYHTLKAGITAAPK